MINLQNVQVKNGSTWNTICPFPVGFVYSSYTNTSPGSTFGGTWTPITGRFPYYNNGVGTGGANSQTVDFSHTHPQKMAFTATYINTNGIAYTSGGTVPSPTIFTEDSNYSGAIGANPIGIQKKLGSKTIPTVPLYQTLYAWRRTA